MTDQRKHVTQMTNLEIDTVSRFASTFPVVSLSAPHITERKRKWNVTDYEILQALRNGDVVEVHANAGTDIRFVMRSDVGHRSICVCASVSGVLVTVWVNSTHDAHTSLDVSQYQWNINLTRVFAEKAGTR